MGGRSWAGPVVWWARSTSGLRKGTLAKGTAPGLARGGGFEGNLIKGTKHPLTHPEFKGQ